MTGPIWLAASEGQATVSDVTASTSCARNRAEVATDPTRIASEAAEHFCPAWPNADRTTSRTARSMSALGVTTIAFLPLVSASSGRSRRNCRNSAAVSNAPVRISRPTRGSATSRCPSAPSETFTSCSASAGTPADSSASTSTAPHRAACGAGLMMTAEPAASAASTEPAGIATGKFHGGVTTVSATGDATAPSTESRDSGQRRVVVGEVDRLGHLGIALVERLTALGRHDLDQAARGPPPARPQPGAGPTPAPPRNAPPTPPPPRPPVAIRVSSTSAEVTVDRATRSTPRSLSAHPAEDRTAPGRVGRQRRIGVGRVGERALITPTTSVSRS